MFNEVRTYIIVTLERSSGYKPFKAIHYNIMESSASEPFNMLNILWLIILNSSLIAAFIQEYVFHHFTLGSNRALS